VPHSGEAEKRPVEPASGSARMDGSYLIDEKQPSVIDPVPERLGVLGLDTMLLWHPLSACSESCSPGARARRSRCGSPDRESVRPGGGNVLLGLAGLIGARRPWFPVWLRAPRSPLAPTPPTVVTGRRPLLVDVELIVDLDGGRVLSKRFGFEDFARALLFGFVAFGRTCCVQSASPPLRAPSISFWACLASLGFLTWVVLYRPTCNAYWHPSGMASYRWAR